MKTAAEHAIALEVLDQEITRHIAAGEIDKPAFDNLKYKVDRAIEGTSKVIAENHLWGKGGSLYRIEGANSHWEALVSAIPLHYAREVTALGKKLDKIKVESLKSQAFYKDCAAYFRCYHEIAANLETLKGLIVSTKARRAAAKTAEEQERQKKFTEYSTLVAVLQQHIDEYVSRAGELATAKFDGWISHLEEHGWDIDKAAPEPTNKDNLISQEGKRTWRSILFNVTDGATGYYDKIRKASLEKKADHVARIKDAAHGDYMAWIYKMIQKIGQPVTTAEMNGNPWVQSIILVTTVDGGRQEWHTQMIVNYSRYGTPFNQFPSRRIDQ